MRGGRSCGVFSGVGVAKKRIDRRVDKLGEYAYFLFYNYVASDEIALQHKPNFT